MAHVTQKFEHLIVLAYGQYNKNIYEERNVSYTRAIAYYVRIKNINNLISKKELKKIYNDYKATYIKRNILINEADYNSDSDDNFITLKDNINFRNDASSNYNSSSSNISSDINEITENNHINANSSSQNSGDGNNNINNNIYNNNKINKNKNEKTENNQKRKNTVKNLRKIVTIIIYFKNIF